jgi:hypothetical protein
MVETMLAADHSKSSRHERTLVMVHVNADLSNLVLLCWRHRRDLLLLEDRYRREGEAVKSA